jgi:hypothetical protein
MNSMSGLSDGDYAYLVWIVTMTNCQSLALHQRGGGDLAMTVGDLSDDEDPEWNLVNQSAMAEEVRAELPRLDLLPDGLDPRCRELPLPGLGDRDDEPFCDGLERRVGTSLGSIRPAHSRLLRKPRRWVS